MRFLTDDEWQNELKLLREVAKKHCENGIIPDNLNKWINSDDMKKLITMIINSIEDLLQKPISK